MRVLLGLKIAVLILALAGVLFVIRKMNGDTMNRAFLALGIEPGTAQSPGFQPGNRLAKQGEERFNLCPTRVHSIVLADGRKVEESKDGMKLKWMAYDPQPREISYLDVEKWLSQHCQIHIEPSQAVAGTYADYVLVRYIDGKETKLLQVDGNQFKVGDQTFKSDDLRQAIDELRRVALF